MRALKGEERALWRETMRDVKPLRKNATLVDKEQSPPEPLRGSSLSRMRGRIKEGTNPTPNAALDRRTAQRLKRGTLTIEARLDLHGMTQSEAHRALARFLTSAQKNGTRVALVITGKSGVLHSAVPRWLDEGENRARILAVSRAYAQHGGDGALYLMLRRAR